MTIAELIRRAEGIVPEASETVIPSYSTTQYSKLDIFNEAAEEFAKYTLCLPKDKKFDCTASTQTYSLMANIPDYFMPREEGFFHLRSDTTSNTTGLSWDRLKPTSVRNLDEEQPSWRTASSSDTLLKYWIDGDIFGVHYTPSNSVTNGFHAYYFAVPSKASALTHYPFTGTTSQDARLSLYDRTLIVYYEYRALGLLGYKNESLAKEKEFYLLCDKAKSEINTRRDLAQESRARPKSYISQMRGMFGR